MHPDVHYTYSGVRLFLVNIPEALHGSMIGYIFVSNDWSQFYD